MDNSKCNTYLSVPLKLSVLSCCRMKWHSLKQQIKEIDFSTETHERKFGRNTVYFIIKETEKRTLWFYYSFPKLYHIYSYARRVFSPYIWPLNMRGCLKFAYEAPNQVALKQTMRSQTMACITELSCEFCVLLRYYAAWQFLTNLSGQPNGPIFKGQEIPYREQSTT
jgi:hypothetical protein